MLGGNVDGLSGLGRDGHAVVGERLVRADESAPSAARPERVRMKRPGWQAMRVGVRVWRSMRVARFSVRRSESGSF